MLLTIDSGCDHYFHGSDRLIILAYFLEKLLLISHQSLCYYCTIVYDGQERLPRCCCRRDRNERQRARRLKGGFCRSAWGSLQTSKLETRFQNLGKVVGGLPRFGGFEVVFSSFQGDHNLLAQPRNSKLDFRTQKHIPWTQALRKQEQGRKSQLAGYL